jgi:hypothetical protein
MTMKTLFILLAILALPGLLAAQEGSKGYVVTDANGRAVYMIPECIVGPTVKATLSLPGATERAEGTIATSQTGFLVQVGAFAKASNVSRLERRLTAEGFTVHTYHATLRGGRLPVTVVTAGGFASRTEAEAAARKIGRAHAVDCMVVATIRTNLAAR